MTYAPVHVLEVHAWGRLAGSLARDPRTGFYAFEYAPDWVRNGVSLDPLHLPARPGVFQFNQLPPGTYHRLPAVIADAIPGAFGNTLINTYMLEHGVDPASITALDRLAYLSDRAMGALEFRPPVEPTPVAATAVVLSDLADAARTVVSGTAGDSPASTSATLAELIELGSSPGGARAKAVVWWNPATKTLQSGPDPTDPGMSAWLLKFDGVDPTGMLAGPHQYCRAEFAYHLMARAAGITMGDSRLISDDAGRQHFITQRFDRVGRRRQHVASLCALAHADFNDLTANSYEQYFATVTALGLGDDALAEAFRRMVFNVAAVNCDDHTKNVGFLLPEGGEWQLSPAYDLTFAHRARSNNAQHLMSVNGKRWDVSSQDLLTVADRFKVPAASELLTDVVSTVRCWPDFAQLAGVPASRTTRIADMLASQDHFESGRQARRRSPRGRPDPDPGTDPISP